MATYTPDRSAQVIVQNRDVLEAIAGLRYATGAIEFAGLPANGNTIAISDGVTTITYTFKDDATAANEVQIESTRDATMANLVDAINLNAPALELANGQPVRDPLRGVVATLVVVAGADNDYCTLRNTRLGSLGNVPITAVGTNLTVSGMSGGADGGTVNVDLVGGVEDVESTLADRMEAYASLRNNVTANDSPITDFAFANKPATAQESNGELQAEYRFFAHANNKTFGVILQFWPASGIGLAAMTIAVTAGNRPTAKHPITGASGTNFYEADTLVVTNDVVPYELKQVADGHAVLIVDERGFRYHNAEVQLNGTDPTTRADVIRRPI